MNILDWLRERREQAKKKRKQQARDKLAHVLREMRSTNNRGLLLKQLIDIPEVAGYSILSGGFKMAYCDVNMHDGYTICGSDLFGNDAIKKAIHKVVQRPKEKHGLHG